MMAAGQAVIETGAEEHKSSGVVPVFEKHRRKVYQFAYQVTGNMDDAMDLTQEAFLRLHREWGRLPEDCDAGWWLLKVVRNLAVDLHRKRSSRRECAVETDVTDVRTRGPETTAMHNELSARLWAEIAVLPPPQREALLLRDWHGLSYAQIADVVGATMSTVTWRIHDARTALRKKMTRYL
jgi:RNA polymerase sigma-70 factor (ECF subfamily)